MFRGMVPLVVAICSIPLALAAAPAGAAKYTLVALKEAPPKEVGEALRKALPKEGVRILDGDKKPYVDLWFPKQVTAPKPGTARVEDGIHLSQQIANGALFGVIRYPKRRTDFRDKSVPAGTFTMRYGIQPQDGDHLGVSDGRDFIMLCPAKDDTKPEPMPEEDVVKLGTKVSGTSHPPVFYLMPMVGREKPKCSPALVHDEDFGWEIIDLELSLAEKKSFRLGLVIVGVAEEF